MHPAHSSSRRAGVLSFVLVGAGLATLGTLGVLSFASSNPAGSAGAGAGSSTVRRRAQPQEIGAVLILSGIDAEGLAAAGVSSLACDAMFEAGSTYCLQADRLGQFQLAHRNLNLAQAAAARPPRDGDINGGDPLPTVEQAQGALDDLRNSAFSFLTSGLDAEQIAKLTKIRANKHWGLSAPYLTVDRTDREWLALRGALSQQRLCQRTGEELPQAAAAVIATADADTTVAQAKTDFASGLTAVKQSWDDHSR
jgi:hypothetical protein